MSAHDFTTWLDGLSLPLQYFDAHELLAKGAGSPQLWGPPPADLWPNILATVLIADVVRHQFGHPLQVTSAYRCPAHNAAVGGGTHSQHLRFNALDLVPLGGSVRDLATIARNIRAEGPLSWVGGLGTYSSFIHIDTRGSIATWTG